LIDNSDYKLVSNVRASKIDLSKITFLKKRVKKGAKSTLFSKSKQNNNFTFQKSCRVYIFYKKTMILGNGAKWNLRKDYEYNIIKK